ncbi:sigma factor [Paracoccus marinaquae]|uniref:RNA polymerase subunit sigma n=1 Tax=Paracoccus marinaquae TaxID=2841926 RepID=A0ABS6AK14_9RHOB|nr:sigma factor [Paracoccus marinaquae]MBU3030566.1 RNA polymerase subunit sigma [Paracoccus marinaquae]
MIARTAQGDRAAFDALYEATSARLHALCLSILKHRPDAEEVLEEVYIRVWQDAGIFAASGLSPMTWLITIARNGAIDRLRRARARPELVRDNAIRAAYLEGASYADLARSMGEPVDVIRDRLRRDLQRLREGAGQ